MGLGLGREALGGNPVLRFTSWVTGAARVA